MKPDKKQLPQLVVLGLLVVMCIGYVSFTVFKPPATETAPKPDASKSSSWKGAVRVAAQEIPTTSTFPDVNAPLARRDPFTAQALGEVKPEVARPAVAQEHPVKSVSIRVPPLIPIGSFSPGQAPDMSVVSSQDMDPEFVLTGVICGYENVAIIRVGNSERHVVRQGQTIDGRYQVLYVSRDGVVLGCKDRRIHLKLGGVRNAS